MKTLITILTVAFCATLNSQVPIMTFDKASADSLRGHYGVYSALDPVELPNGTYALPTRCLKDPDLYREWTIIDHADTTILRFEAADYMIKENQGSTEIREMPKVGERVTTDIIYQYTKEGATIEETVTELVICIRTHDRTAAEPKDEPLNWTIKEAQVIDR